MYLEAPDLDLRVLPVHSRHEGGSHRVNAFLRGKRTSRRGRMLQIVGLLEEHDVPYALHLQTVRGELIHAIRHPRWLGE